MLSKTFCRHQDAADSGVVVELEAIGSVAGLASLLTP